MGMTRQKSPRSLKSKALQLLAQREQSRLELRRKLMAHAVAEEAAEHSSGTGSPGDVGNMLPAAEDEAESLAEPRRLHDADVHSHLQSRHASSCPSQRGAGPGGDSLSAKDVTATAAQRVDEVLTWLEAQRFQSDARFAESRIHARAARYGDLRIRQELKRHGIALGTEALRALGTTEGSRAWAVWERRFGTAPATPAELARQSRFLAARGFSPEAVCQVLQRARAARMHADATFDDE